MSGGDQQRIRSVLSLIRELSGQVTRAESVADLFERSFLVLHPIVSFDLGAAVMVESNLDLHIVTRAGGASLVDDRLIERVRSQLQHIIPPSFAAADVVVRAERNTLPAGTIHGRDCLAHEVHTLLRLADRTAGLLVFYRSEPFEEMDRDIIEIFAAEMAMLLANLTAQERILNLADTDDLTGIWNKRYFRRHLPQEIERARIYAVPLSLLMLDVDDFKDINDKYGHTVGDVVLSELCGAVRETLRPPDLFARFGGDEFAIILPHTDLGGACSVAGRMLAKVRSLSVPHEDDGAIRCSISIGAAGFQGEGDATDLIRRADEQLYLSKRQGKNRYTATS